MLSRILSDPQAIFLVILFFGASIFVHEWGHYLAARLQRETGRAEAAARSVRTALRICGQLSDAAEVPYAEGLTVARFRALLEGERP